MNIDQDGLATDSTILGFDFVETSEPIRTVSRNVKDVGKFLGIALGAGFISGISLGIGLWFSAPYLPQAGTVIHYMIQLLIQ